jgi:hypothetical protein
LYRNGAAKTEWRWLHIMRAIEFQSCGGSCLVLEGGVEVDRRRLLCHSLRVDGGSRSDADVVRCPVLVVQLVSSGRRRIPLLGKGSSRWARRRSCCARCLDPRVPVGPGGLALQKA